MMREEGTRGLVRAKNADRGEVASFALCENEDNRQKVADLIAYTEKNRDDYTVLNPWTPG